MTGDPRRWLPAAAAVLAIAAMAVAARRDGPLNSVSTGLWDGARPAMALAAVVLLGVIAANFAKHRDDGYGVLHRAGTATAVLLTAAAVLTPIGLLLFGRKPEPPQQPEGSPTPQTPRTRPRSGQELDAGSQRGGKSFAGWIGQALLYLILAAALALLIYVLVKLLSRRWSRPSVTLLRFDALAPELDQLAEAVAAGAEALEYDGDAREAVIACYSAMESAVTAGGTRRQATDTPEEFLRRVTLAKLIPDEPARRLTDLFREARFSSHRISEEKRDAAREALREISEYLRIRAEESAAATARSQAAAAVASAASVAGGGSPGSNGSAGPAGSPSGGRL
jgi:hypothetical protein